MCINLNLQSSFNEKTLKSNGYFIEYNRNIE